MIKKYAKDLDEKSRLEFLNSLPHQYHEENILHACILSNIKDYDTFINYVNKFLPYVTNWSVSDTICNKHLEKHKSQLINEIYKWLKSDELYRVRYAVKCLMIYYLNEDFKEEHLQKVGKRNKVHLPDIMHHKRKAGGLRATTPLSPLLPLTSADLVTLAQVLPILCRPEWLSGRCKEVCRP